MKVEGWSFKVEVWMSKFEVEIWSWNLSCNLKLKYTGLEHRQTLRACDFHFNLQIEIENENIDK